MDMRIVRGTKDLGLVRGATGAHFVECDDGTGPYLVKFADSSRAVTNDFLGTLSAAQLIGLARPDNTLVAIGQELRSQAPTTCGTRGSSPWCGTTVRKRSRLLRPGDSAGAWISEDRGALQRRDRPGDGLPRQLDTYRRPR